MTYTELSGPKRASHISGISVQVVFLTFLNPAVVTECLLSVSS